MEHASRSLSMMAGDKKTFKISVIDDKPDSVCNELDEIGSYLDDEGFELKLEKYKNAKMWEKIDSTTDIAFIDKNLDNASGIDVVDSIRKSHKLLDILIYSRGGIGNEDLARLSNYAMVEVAKEKDQIIGKLRGLVNRNISKWKDMIFMRGVVISRLIDLEQEIDAVLTKVFSPVQDEEFRLLVLEKSMSMQDKRDILRCITKDMEEKPFNVRDLQEIQESRNMLAHCRRSEEDPNVLIKGGTDKLVDRDEIGKIFERANRFSERLESFKRGLG